MNHGAWQIHFEGGYSVIVSCEIGRFNDALTEAVGTVSAKVVGATYHPLMFVAQLALDKDEREGV